MDKDDNSGVIETEETVTTVETPEPERPATPNALDHARALVSDRAQLLAENRDLRSQLGTFKGALAQLKGENDELRESVATLTTDLDGMRADYEAAVAREQSLAAAVTDELASLGVPSVELPAGAAGPIKGPLQEALDEFTAATDPLAKALEARRHRDLAAAQKAAQN